MAGVRLFVNEKTIKKDGTAAIYALVYISGKSIKINTGVSHPFTQIDQEEKKVKGKGKEVKDKNLMIERCLSAINEIMVRYRLQHKKLTPELLKQEYFNPTNYLDFYAWFDAKLKERLKNKEITASSERHQRVLYNKLKEFRENLSFAEIDLKFLTSFRGHLRKKNSPNTVQKTFAYLSAYLNIAVRESIIDNNPLEFMKLSRVETTIVYLTEDELKKLWAVYQKQSLAGNLHVTLRHFLFMCFTGVRVSDLKRLMKDHVKANQLKFIPYKTRTKKQKEVTIPLVSRAIQLITDENSDLPYLFKCYSDQKMNSYLKRIAETCNIKKPIRNHAGRHTFATLFLEKTSDVATLQRLLNHTNISETMKYVHLSTKKIADQMQSFDRLLKL